MRAVAKFEMARSVTWTKFRGRATVRLATAQIMALTRGS